MQANKKPAIVIDENFAVWVGNLTDATLKLEPGELFGFGRGAWEEKQVRRHLRQPTLLSSQYSQCAINLINQSLRPKTDWVKLM